MQRLFDATEQRQHTRLNNLSHCLRSQLALLNFLHRCQTATGGGVNGGAVQALANQSTTSAPMPAPPSASAPAPPPAPASSPSAAPKSSGFMNFANPIKFGGANKSASAPPSMKGGPAPAPYKPTLAELAAGIIPGGAGQMRPSMERNSESSTASSDGRASLQASAKAKTSAPEVASFDNDDDSDSASDDAEEDETAADDPSNPDNNIEKAVRHMRVALTSLQRNSGLILEKEKVEPYDHSNCSDCAVVYDMANDCCMHIAAANFRSKQCAERLLRLTSYKEKMRENAELLDSQDP